MMKISVVIRTLNEEAYLNELLESIKKQNKDNFSNRLLYINQLIIGRKFNRNFSFQ